MGLKAQELTKSISLSLPVTSSVDRSFLGQLILDFIGFLLYERHQIPEPVRLLRRNYERQKTLDKTSKPNLKVTQMAKSHQCVAKFLDTLSQIEQALLGALVGNDVTEFVLVFGATPLSAKDVYKINLSDFSSDEKCSKYSQQKLTHCSRELCVQMMQCEDFFKESKGITSVFLFIKSKMQKAPKGWQAWPHFKIPEKKLRLVLSLHPSLEKKKEFDDRVKNKENVSEGKVSTSQDTNTACCQKPELGAKFKVTRSQRSLNMKPRKLLYDVTGNSNSENQSDCLASNNMTENDLETENTVINCSISQTENKNSKSKPVFHTPLPPKDDCEITNQKFDRPVQISTTNIDSATEEDKSINDDNVKLELGNKPVKTESKENPMFVHQPHLNIETSLENSSLTRNCSKSIESMTKHTGSISVSTASISHSPTNITIQKPSKNESKTNKLDPNSTNNPAKESQFIYFKLSLGLKGFKY